MDLITKADDERLDDDAYTNVDLFQASLRAVIAERDAIALKYGDELRQRIDMRTDLAAALAQLAEKEK